MTNRVVHKLRQKIFEDWFEASAVSTSDRMLWEHWWHRARQAGMHVDDVARMFDELISASRKD